MADNYLTGKNGWVGVNVGGTLNTTTGVVAGGISGAASNGGPNLIRITTAAAHGLVTGTTVKITGVVGTTEANGTWTITVISSTTFDLVGSVFVNAYVSGGLLAQYYSFGTWKLDIKCNLPNITNFTSAGFQALLAGITSGALSLSGPYNNTNMPFTAGTQYLWMLGYSASVYIAVPAIINGISPGQDVNKNAEVSITADSNGVFLAAIA